MNSDFKNGFEKSAGIFLKDLTDGMTPKEKKLVKENTSFLYNKAPIGIGGAIVGAHTGLMVGKSLPNSLIGAAAGLGTMKLTEHLVGKLNFVKRNKVKRRQELIERARKNKKLKKLGQ